MGRAGYFWRLQGTAHGTWLRPLASGEDKGRHLDMAGGLRVARAPLARIVATLALQDLGRVPKEVLRHQLLSSKEPKVTRTELTLCV